MSLFCKKYEIMKFLSFKSLTALPKVIKQDDRSFMSEPLKLLFLCTGNSCRSQMAEGWTRQLKGDQMKPFLPGSKRMDLTLI